MSGGSATGRRKSCPADHTPVVQPTEPTPPLNKSQQRAAEGLMDEPHEVLATTAAVSQYMAQAIGR